MIKWIVRILSQRLEDGKNRAERREATKQRNRIIRSSNAIHRK